MFSPKVLDRQTQLLRCSVPGGERRTRPRTAGISLRELPVLGAQTGCARRIALRRCATPVPLRSSAPQRRSAARPPTALPAPPSGVTRSASRRHVAVRRAVASCTVGSRRGAGGWRLRRLCGAEQRSAAGAVRRAAPDRREAFMGRPRSGAGAEGIAAAPRSEQRRGVDAKRRPPQRSRKRRPPAPLRARSSAADGNAITPPASTRPSTSRTRSPARRPSRAGRPDRASAGSRRAGIRSA